MNARSPAGRAEDRIAVISDTHGLLRPSVLRTLEGARLILHAGDVGSDDILDRLNAIAPVRAVRGNVDHSGAAGRLPLTETLEVDGHLIHMLHIVEDLDLDPLSAGLAAVIYGHTHRPALERRRGVLFLNPGSVGPRRFSLPASMAYLTTDETGVAARLVTLEE